MPLPTDILTRLQTDPTPADFPTYRANDLLHGFLHFVTLNTHALTYVRLVHLSLQQHTVTDPPPNSPNLLNRTQVIKN